MPVKNAQEPVNFLELENFEDWPALEEMRLAHEDQGEKLRQAETAARDALRSYALLYSGFNVRQETSTSVFSGKILTQGNLPPEVQEALDARHAAEQRLEAVRRETAASRRRLDVATAMARDNSRPAMARQLAAPLDALISGLESAACVDRLLGAADRWQYSQERQAAQGLLTYLEHCRKLLG